MTQAPPPSGSLSKSALQSAQIASANGDRPVCVDSNVLLRGQKTVEISHNGATYRLQATRLGKLILTK